MDALERRLWGSVVGSGCVVRATHEAVGLCIAASLETFVGLLEQLLALYLQFV